MRIKENEILAIKSFIKRYDDKAKVFLFGSRTDDSKKGGDIDLLILSGKLNLTDKIKIKTTLYELIGEQRIDLMVAQAINSSFLEHIYKGSVLL